jgi:hypothetical protein
MNIFGRTDLIATNTLKNKERKINFYNRKANIKILIYLNLSVCWSEDINTFLTNEMKILEINFEENHKNCFFLIVGTDINLNS